MSVNLDLYRGAVGAFNSRLCCKNIYNNISIRKLGVLLPKFFIGHWNLNSISAHIFIKISLLETYTATHKLDVICLSETYFDSSMTNDDDNLEIPGYDLFRADRPSNTK